MSIDGSGRFASSTSAIGMGVNADGVEMSIMSLDVEFAHRKGCERVDDDDDAIGKDAELATSRDKPFVSALSVDSGS